MKYSYFRVTGTVMASLLLALLMACAGLQSDSGFPSFARPSTAVNIAERGKTCASAGCNYYTSYDFPGENTELLRFYQDTNYGCEKISDGTPELSLGFKEPIWLCKYKHSNDMIYIGFPLLESSASEQSIPVHVWITRQE
jgi:hypothetical protein